MQVAGNCVASLLVDAPNGAASLSHQQLGSLTRKPAASFLLNIHRHQLSPSKIMTFRGELPILHQKGADQNAST